MSAFPDHPAASTKKAAVKKRRWLLRAAIVLLGVILLVAIVVQIVLWSDLPRGIVVGQIEQQLGLRLKVKSLATGWLGHTQLNDVTIGLPLADKAFLEVPVMKVKNTSLFGLLLGRSVEVQAIELDQPHLHVWQDSAGRWNLQEVTELLARAGGKKTGQESAKTSNPTVPNIHLAGGIISITDNKKRSLDIQPLNVDGYRETGVSWKYDVEIPDHVSITGRLVPGGTFSHEVAIKIQDVDVWAKPWMADFPKVTVDAAWHGELSETGIAGRLDIHKAAVGLKTGDAEAYGAVAASVGGGVITLRPDNLLLKTGQKVLPDLSVASGSISYLQASSELKVEQLIVKLFGGPARITAAYNFAANTGRIDAGWEKLGLPNSKITHSGSFAASFHQPFPNKITLDGNLKSTGNTSSGPWEVSAAFGADGESFQNFDWTLAAGKLEWRRQGEGVQLNGLTMAGSLRDQALVLRSINLPKQDLLTGGAVYHFTGNQVWQASLRGQHWPFHPISGTELAFELKAHGDKMQASLDDFILKSPDARFSANGVYTYGNPKPFKADVRVTNAPPTDIPAAVASSTEAKIINGTIEGGADLEGTLAPLDLRVKGNLRGREIDIRGNHLGELNLLLSDQSHIDADGAFIYTESLALLGGNWGLDGVYLFDSNALRVDVNLKGVALKDLATLANHQDITGTIDGKISIFVPGLNPDPNHLEVPPAEFKLHDINVSGVKVDEIDATFSLSEGNLALNPIHLKRGEGRGEVHVGMSLHDLRRIDLGAGFSEWPIEIPGAVVRINVWVGLPDARIDLPNPKAPDPTQRPLRITARKIDARAATTLKGELLGDLIAHAGVDGREIDVRAVHMKLLGGRFDGQAHGDLDHPKGMTAEFSWEKLDLEKLALIFPQLNDFKGRLTGDLRLAPATVPRPREPLALVITTQFDNGAFRTIPIKDARIAAYIGPNPEAPDAGWRAVMEDNAVDPSFLHAASGTIELWGRFGAHGRGTASQAQLTFHELDLNQIVHAFEPTAAAMPGQVAGAIMLLRAPAPPHRLPPVPINRMFPGPPAIPIPVSTKPSPDDSPLKQLLEPIYGEGHVELTHTNLAQFGPFAFLYNASNLFQDVRGAEGNGNMQFHLEQGTLTVEHLRYFNRGTEIRAVASVKNLWDVPNCPVVGTAFLTARPLRNVTLPLLADFDTVLTAIQASLKLTGVRVEGTLHKYHIIGPLGFTDMTDDLRRFLVGDVKGELQGGAGG